MVLLWYVKIYHGTNPYHRIYTALQGASNDTMEGTETMAL